MQCHCSVLHNSVLTSTSSRMRLRFVVEGMRQDQVIVIIIINISNIIIISIIINSKIIIVILINTMIMIMIMIMIIIIINTMIMITSNKQDFNDFSMRGSFRFVNTLCTDSTVARWFYIDDNDNVRRWMMMMTMMIMTNHRVTRM